MKELHPSIAKIKADMKKRGITQVEIAEKTSLPLGSINHIFSGKSQYPKFDTIETIKKYVYGNDGITETSELDNDMIKYGLSAWDYKKLTPEQKKIITGIVKQFLNEPAQPTPTPIPEPVPAPQPKMIQMKIAARGAPSQIITVTEQQMMEAYEELQKAKAKMKANEKDE